MTPPAERMRKYRAKLKVKRALQEAGRYFSRTELAALVESVTPACVTVTQAAVTAPRTVTPIPVTPSTVIPFPVTVAA